MVKFRKKEKNTIVLASVLFVGGPILGLFPAVWALRAGVGSTHQPHKSKNLLKHNVNAFASTQWNIYYYYHYYYNY